MQEARHRCGYCLAPQDLSHIALEIEHIMPLGAGGTDAADNLWAACSTCNNNKGSDLATLDRTGTQIVPLFNPRQHTWREHFRFEGAQIVGSTAIDQATVRLLRLNTPERAAARQILIETGLYPPQLSSPG